MKKRFISTVVLGIALSGVSAFAEEGNAVAVPTLYAMPVAVSSIEIKDVNVSNISVPSSVYPVTERSEVIGAKSLTRIQARGAQLIKERVKSLNQNKEAVLKSKDLTADQKSAFSSFFDGKVVELNTLGKNIASSTEASSTKVLVSSIFTDFRIYGVVIPQVRLQKRIYEVQNYITKITESFTKVQANIDAEKAKGKDITVWQKNLDDAKALVATDTTKLSALMTRINALKPSDYGTTSKMVITEVNNGVRSVVKDLNSIGKKVKKPSNLISNKESHYRLNLTSWTWTSSITDGATTTAPEGGKFVLSFMKDKRISSTTDCNTIGASYNVNENNLTFGPMMMTRMFCEGSKEGVYSDLLSTTSSYKIEGTTLTLTNSKGVMLFSKKN